MPSVDSSKRSAAIEVSRARMYLINTQRRIERLLPQRSSATKDRKLSTLRTLESGLSKELDYWIKLDQVGID